MKKNNKRGFKEKKITPTPPESSPIHFEKGTPLRKQMHRGKIKGYHSLWEITLGHMIEIKRSAIYGVRGQDTTILS